MAKDNLSYLVNYLLKAHDISIDSDELEFQIKTHPTYPSLHAITGVLNHFNIENMAIEVPRELDILHQLPDTFLAQIKVNTQSQFAIVTKKGDALSLTKNKKTKETISQSDFLEQFTGIVLAVEKEEKSDNNVSRSKNSERIVKISAVTASILLTLSFLNANPSVFYFTFFVLSLIGIYISYTIIKQESGQTTVLGDAFCSNPTEKKNCNAVLSSKGATINAFLKVSDLSFIYFLGSVLSIFMLIVSSKNLFPILLVSLIALPIVLYSVFYQAFIIKKWCALCLSIVAVLCLQAVIAFSNYVPLFDSQSVFLTGLSFSLSAAFWLSQSQIIKRNVELEDIKIKHFRFKRNFELFNTQLNKSTVLNTHIATTKEIVFGNPKSNLHLTVVTNPLCGHCKPVHRLVENLLKQCNDAVKITIRFNVNTKDMSNIGTQIALRLLELYDTKPSSLCLEAMHDIYNNSTTDQWLKKWNACNATETYETVLNTESQWCTENNITFTPELLINGRAFPKIYDREDLIYFIDDLEEQTLNDESIETSKAVLQN